MIVNVKVNDGVIKYDRFIETNKRDESEIIIACTEKGVLKCADDGDWVKLDFSADRMDRNFIEKYFKIINID